MYLLPPNVHFLPWQLREFQSLPADPGSQNAEGQAMARST